MQRVGDTARAAAQHVKRCKAWNDATGENETTRESDTAACGRHSVVGDTARAATRRLW